MILQKLKNRKQIRKINKKTNSNFSSSTFLDGAEVKGFNYSQNNVNLRGSIIGYGTYFGSNVRLSRSKIGNYASLGSNINCVEHNHLLTVVTTYPPVYHKCPHLPTNFLDKNFASAELKTQSGFSCEIGNDVWIGHNVLIRGGCNW